MWAARWILAGLTLALSSAGSAQAQEAIAVDLELLLAVDTSSSVDQEEFLLQRQGLAAAFRDPDVIAAIESVGDDGIAAYLQWGFGYKQRMAVDWMAVRDAESAEAFARAIEASPRYFVGNGTSIAWAMTAGAQRIYQNRFLGSRRTIDISGDGRNNAGGQPRRVRDVLVASDFTINALAILDGDASLGRYFEDNVIGGTGAFVITAESFDDYAAAIRRKLLREISPPVAEAPSEVDLAQVGDPPEPSTTSGSPY